MITIQDKELLQFSKKNASDLIEKWSKHLNRYFPKPEPQMASDRAGDVHW